VLAVLAALLLAQLLPTARTTARPSGILAAPPEVVSILRRACYDCHSNETRWPWYSRVAPLSWIIVHDARRGRQELNFSDWARYYPATRRRKLAWMGRALRTETMPPRPYRLLHPGARLTPADQAVLQRWITSALRTPSEK
jgi:Haem-binding domain